MFRSFSTQDDDIAPPPPRNEPEEAPVDVLSSSLEIPETSVVRDGLICAVGAYAFVERLHAKTLKDLGALPLSRVTPACHVCPLPFSSGVAVGHRFIDGQLGELQQPSEKKIRKKEVARGVSASSYTLSEASVPRFATLFGAASGRIRGCGLLPEGGVTSRHSAGGVFGMDYVPPESVASGDGMSGAFLCGTRAFQIADRGDADIWAVMWSCDIDADDESPARLRAMYSAGSSGTTSRSDGLKYVKEWNSFFVGCTIRQAAVARHDLTREDEPVMLYGNRSESVRAVDADPSSKLIVCSCFNKSVRVYAYGQKELVARVKLDSEGISGMCDASRHLMIAGVTYGKVELFDTRMITERLGVVQAHDRGSVTGMDIVSVKAGLYVSCNSRDPCTVSLWNEYGKVINRFETVHSNCDVCFAPYASGLAARRLLEEAEERCSFVVGFQFFGGAKLICRAVSREVFLFKSLVVRTS